VADLEPLTVRENFGDTDEANVPDFVGVTNAVIDATLLITAEVVGLTVIVNKLEGQENVE
jgi:hypothetical protein